MSTLTVLATAYNEEKVIDEFYERITNVLESTPNNSAELLFGSYGSTNTILEKIISLQAAAPTISYANLSRGLIKDAAVIIGTALKDSQKLAPNLFDLWLLGHEAIPEQRSRRQRGSFIKRLSSWIGNRRMATLYSRDPTSAGDGKQR